MIHVRKNVKGKGHLVLRFVPETDWSKLSLQVMVRNGKLSTYGSLHPEATDPMEFSENFDSGLLEGRSGIVNMGMLGPLAIMKFVSESDRTDAVVTIWGDGKSRNCFWRAPMISTDSDHVFRRRIVLKPKTKIPAITMGVRKSDHWPDSYSLKSENPNIRIPDEHSPVIVIGRRKSDVYKGELHALDAGGYKDIANFEIEVVGA